MHGLLLDAAMNFAINAALGGRDRTRATLEMKVETMRPALVGEPYRLRGEVVRMARQVAYAEATVVDEEDQMVSRSTGTFLLHRHVGQGDGPRGDNATAARCVTDPPVRASPSASAAGSWSASCRCPWLRWWW